MAGLPTLLSRLDGVDKVDVDTSSSMATITMKKGKSLDRSAVENALKGTDMGVKSFAEHKKG